MSINVVASCRYKKIYNLSIKHYNHKLVTLTLIFDKRRGYHYIRYRLPSIKDIDGNYKQRKFKPDENLKFVFNEGFLALTFKGFFSLS